MLDQAITMLAAAYFYLKDLHSSMYSSDIKAMPSSILTPPN